MSDDLFSMQDGGAGGSDDDDLFAAFGSGDPLSDSDLFASLDAPQTGDAFGGEDLFGSKPPAAPPEPPPVPAASAPAEPAAPASSDSPDWLKELDSFQDMDMAETQAQAQGQTQVASPATAQAAPSSGPLQAMAGTGPRGMAFGMTAQQRMVLAIFLFLDVAVLGCAILVGIGAIALPF